jgi:hypothetical protein
MQTKVNNWVDRFREFHSMSTTEQIVRLVYFHTVVESRGSISRQELEVLFRFVEVPVPANVPQLLTHLTGKGRRLIKDGAEYSLRREVRISISDELNPVTPASAPIPVGTVPAFEFADRKFSDQKIQTLLIEAKRCYATECWNACGILMRIILERTLDSVSPAIKSANGLKDKLNYCVSNPGHFSKTIVEGLKELKGGKLLGDIVAHHSSILLDKHDVDLVTTPFRLFLKEVKTI